jgi:hypothetical protein
VTVRGIMADVTFTDIVLSAADESGRIVGHWSTDDSSLTVLSCGGVRHNSHIKKSSVQAVWHASSRLAGTIKIQ